MTPAPRAVIVTVGSELTTGRIADTNAQWAARELNRLGIEVGLILSVDDRTEAIVDALSVCRGRGEIVWITGGLGPTRDDVTAAAVARALGARLTEDPATVRRVRARCAARGVEPSAASLRQALVPEGAEAVDNPVGTAPGIVLESGGSVIVIMPGVPAEMKAIAAAHVLPRLAGRGRPAVNRVYRFAGLPEAGVGEAVDDLWSSAREGERFALELDRGEVILRVTAGDSGRAEELDREIVRRLGSHMSSARDRALEEEVVVLLRGNGDEIATVESLTGGLVAARLAGVPGASKVVRGGWVTYQDAAKADMLGISPDLIKRHGAVSVEVAAAMAEAGRMKSGAGISVSTTGWAGPEGGTAEDPVGTVYVGLASRAGTDVARKSFGGDRQTVRDHAATAALDAVRRLLAGK